MSTITGANIYRYQLMTIHSMLRLEVETGIKKYSGAKLTNKVRHIIGSKTRSKVKLLREFEACITDNEWVKAYIKAKDASLIPEEG